MDIVKAGVAEAVQLDQACTYEMVSPYSIASGSRAVGWRVATSAALLPTAQARAVRIPRCRPARCPGDAASDFAAVNSKPIPERKTQHGRSLLAPIRRLSP